jgi:hypothetical protein
LNNERLSWSSNNSAGAYASPLKWTVAGNRGNTGGSLNDVGTHGSCRSSTVYGINSRILHFLSSNAYMGNHNRGSGLTVRCLKN